MPLEEPAVVDINATHASVTERYYTPKYKIDVVRQGEDHQILLHSNRVCVVTLAESHPILALKKEVTKVDFQIDQKTDRLKNKVSGKGKKGAQWLQDGSPLCRATCSDGSIYVIRSCINASLIEINTRLMEHPHLLNKKPDSSGFVALLLTGLREHDKVINKLLTREQYMEAMEARATKAAGTEGEKLPESVLKTVDGPKKDTEMESGDADKNSGDTDKNSGDTDKNSGDTDKNSGDTDKNSGDTDKNSGDTDKNSGDTDKNSGDADKNSEDTDKNSIEKCDSSEKSVDSGETEVKMDTAAAKNDATANKDHEDTNTKTDAEELDQTSAKKAKTG